MAERLSEVVSIGLEAINRVQATQRPDAAELYQNTVRRFGGARNVSAATSSARPKPGRKPQTIKCHMFLLAKKSDFLPPLCEQNRLTRNGLGSPKHELPGLTETSLKVTKFSLDRGLADFEDFIIASYPDAPLSRTGFDLGRVNEGKRLEIIVPSSLADLRIKLKKGRLIIIPKREILLPLTQNQHALSPNSIMDIDHPNSSSAVTPNPPSAVALSIQNEAQNQQAPTPTRIMGISLQNPTAGIAAIPPSIVGTRVQNEAQNQQAPNSTSTVDLRLQNPTIGVAAIPPSIVGTNIQNETQNQQAPDPTSIMDISLQNSTTGVTAIPSSIVGTSMQNETQNPSPHPISITDISLQNPTTGVTAIPPSIVGTSLQNENDNVAVPTGWPSESSCSDESDEMPAASLIRPRTPRARRLAAVQCRATIQSYAARIQRRHGSARSEISTSGVQVAESDNVADVMGVPSDNSADSFDVMEILDSEDEELQRAIDASLQAAMANNQESFIQDSSSIGIKDLLNDLQMSINTSCQQEIIISRRCVLSSAFRAIRRPFFDFNCRLYVKFSGELGEDHGGPRREFFRLALQELSHSTLFEGKDGFKVFTHNVEKLEDKQYRLAGSLIAMSVLHDGPGMSFMHPVLYDLMTGVDVSLDNFNLDQIPDEDCRTALKELREADTDDKRDSVLSAHGDWMAQQGMPVIWRLKVEDRIKAVANLVKQQIFYRTSAEISDFKNGLNVCGLWDRILQHPSTWKEIMCPKSIPLDKTQFMTLYEVEWSPEGSNRRGQEEDTVYSWEVFLQEVQEKRTSITFCDLLSFITGADSIPPLGFPNKIKIQFFPTESGIKRLPYVSTCALLLSLPRGISDPGDLQEMTLRAIKESPGFEKI